MTALIEKVAEITNRDPVVARAAIAVVLKEMIKEMPREENEANNTWFVRYFARENGIDL